MSGACVPAHLQVTTQAAFDAAATVTIDAATIAPTDLHTALFHPDQSALPARLRDALGAVGPVSGGPAALVTHLTDQGITALDGQYAASAAKVARQCQAGTGDGRHWLRFLHLTRHLGTPVAEQRSTLADVATGPVALLAQLDTAPMVVVEVSHAFVSEFAQQQRIRLLDYLLSLTPGVRVRITGSRLAIRRLVDHHDADLPGEVVAAARAHLAGGADGRARAPAQRAAGAVDALGLGERQAGYWRLLARVCTARDGSVAQAGLGEDLVFDDVSASAIRRRAGRLEELGLIERPRRNGGIHLRPTAAGQAALATVREEAPSLLGGWATGDTPADHSDVSTQADPPTVSDPPNATLGPCTPSAHEGGEEADRPTAEGQTATASGAGGSTPTARFLALHEHHGAAAAAPADGGIAFEERSLSGAVDDRDVGWSVDEERQEVVVEATASPVMAFTAVRLCAALLNEKAEAQLLTREKLNGGPGKYSLEGLVIDNPYVLRTGRTLGWLRNVDCEGKRFLDRLREARTDLLAACQEVAEAAEGGVYDHEELGVILRKAHGLQGVLVGLYDLLGYDVVRKIRVPDPSSIDAGEFAHFLLHQTACSSRYGAYTAYRYLYEDDEEKRGDTLSAPDVSADDYRGTIAGSWTIVGPDVEQFRPALQDPTQYDLEVQEEGQNVAEFVLDVAVVDGHRREAVAEATARLAPYKNLRPARRMTTVLHAMTGSTVAAAAAIGGLGPADDHRELDHGDLEYGLWALVGETETGEAYFERFGAGDLLPAIGGSTVSEVVAALLHREETLSTSELASAAGVSTQSIRDNRESFERLGALGLLELGAGEAGCADQWGFSFPDVGAALDGESEEGVGAAIFEEVAWGSDGWELSDAIFEFLVTLADDYDQSVRLAFGGDTALAAFTGPPEHRDLDSLLASVPTFAGSLTILARFLATTLPGARSRGTVRLGQVPDAAATQQDLSSVPAA